MGGRIFKLQVGVHSARAGIFPTRVETSHVQAFEVQRRKSKRVVSQITMKVIVDKGPVECGIEAYEHGLTIAHLYREPVLKRSHRLLGVQSFTLEHLKGQPAYLERFGHCAGAGGFELYVEPALQVVSPTSP